MNGVPAGVHQLRVTLYASSNANGTVLGELSTVADLCGGGPGGTTATIQSTNATVASSLQVVPGSATLFEQQTKSFFATAFSGSQVVFTPEDGISWSVTGGIGTVGADGQLTASTAGTGAVVATLASPALTGSAAVTVQQRQVTQGKWTVMVFMNASNDLFSFSDQDVNEMERVAGNAGVRFVVQWKQSQSAFPSSSFDGVRRVLVKPDTTDQVVSEVIQNNLRQTNGSALDMGDPDTLNDFVTWAKENYPADRYVLILWNHGNGWRRSAEESWASRAFSYDDEFGTAIQTWDIGEALQGHTVDIISWDSSLMQMMEVAYEARDHADYIVGSEESPPGEGLPYDSVFQVFRDNPDGSTAVLSKAFVDGMLNHTPYNSRKITQSVIDTSKVVDLAAAVDALALQLTANLSDLTLVLPSVRDTAQSYSPTTTRVYRDLVHICELLEANSSVPAAVKTAAADVRAKVAEAVIWEGHNSNSPNSNGIAIDFSSSSTFASFSFDYARMKFAQDTNWNEFLQQAP